MMKNFKIFLLSFALIAGFLTSCSNEDSVVEEQNINETEAITQSLNRLAQQFDNDGNVVATSNPAGNIVFDFGFDFIYPLNLSFNNGATVAVNNLDELIEILINSTDNLYVNGIEFPFEVEIYDEDSDAIVVISINNEEEFLDLIEDLWDDDDSCECYEVYDPVCIEIQDPNGNSFVITYPNECYALCDGFTPNDFSNNCEEDYNNPGGFECFEFNFPISIVTDADVTIVVNSQNELDNALYNTYSFDFVYPFQITTDDGDIETIEDAEDFYEELEDCFDDYEEPCLLDIASLEVLLQECDNMEAEIYNANGDNLENEYYLAFDGNGELIVNGEPTVVDSGSWSISTTNENTILTINGLLTFTDLNGSWELSECEELELEFTNGNQSLEIDLDCEDIIVEPCDECDDEEYDPVCVEFTDSNGNIIRLPFNNECEALCEGFTSEDIIDCEENSDCTIDPVLVILLECPWTVNNSITYEFDDNGEVTISGSGLTTVGSWTIFMGNNGYPVVNIEANIGNFNDEWHFVDCNLINSLQVNSATNPASQIALDCE
ncbi:hypothetical protein [Psychroserpens sp. S379A]|uniref:hypothetical protein n=1 Tax=Psychroserpens sp. S379A TaxID=3415137 RepID=UPI003C7AC24A